LVCPSDMRQKIEWMIAREIKHARAGKPAQIILKVNSLSDAKLISKLQEAAKAGVVVQMIVRGIYCFVQPGGKGTIPVQAISIVDEYLEHARVLLFHNLGKEKVYISSADWMVRNLDHRVEAAVPVNNAAIASELRDIIHIQLRDNVKARILDNELRNIYVPSAGKRKIRSQIEIYHYLYRKNSAQ
ncbi:MAG TPA: phospholipase D-like domain-containing protein, partial [Sediminibacterium sp.]|nr:phospholipase D-like domain-containing protein [Sediminibacterium sp.]